MSSQRAPTPDRDESAPVLGETSVTVDRTEADPDHCIIAIGTDSGALEVVAFAREDLSDVDAKQVVDDLAAELGIGGDVHVE